MRYFIPDRPIGGDPAATSTVTPGWTTGRDVNQDGGEPRDFWLPRWDT